MTGLSSQHTDTAGKRLQLLREMVPGLRLAIMPNIDNPGPVLERRDVAAMARSFGFEVTTSEIGERKISRPLWRCLVAAA